MEVFFDCKSYSTARPWSIEWTFYGIAPNTVAAAIAFEMAHNLILEWVLSIATVWALDTDYGRWQTRTKGERNVRQESGNKILCPQDCRRRNYTGKRSLID
jgi:hypothetical protein